MTTLAHQSGFCDYSASAIRTRVALVQSSGAPTSERSDPYTEWAIRFDQGLKRAGDRIRSWTCDAATLANDGLEAPSREAIDRALNVVNRLKELVMDRVTLATGPRPWPIFRGVSLGSDGEICFEIGATPFTAIYEIDSDGSLTALSFKDNQLQSREVISRRPNPS